MIDRFNFYDVYGYFLPGLALLAVIWLPFGLFEHAWPASQFSSAVAALGLAYIAGHILQTLTVHSLPSSQEDSFGKLRKPSDFLLDESDSTFSEVFKAKIGEVVIEAFDIDVAIGNLPADASTKSAIDKRRQDAFFLSRGVLIRGKMALYTEQFQGLYSLMRGLTGAFLIGFVYILGWSASLEKSHCALLLAGAFAAIGVMTSILTTARVVWRKKKSSSDTLEKVVSLGVLLAALGFGYLSGIRHAITRADAILCLCVSLGALFASLRSYGAYQFFAKEFAKAVWRDFVGYKVAQIS